MLPDGKRFLVWIHVQADPNLWISITLDCKAVPKCSASIQWAHQHAAKHLRSFQISRAQMTHVFCIISGVPLIHLPRKTCAFTSTCRKLHRLERVGVQCQERPAIAPALHQLEWTHSLPYFGFVLCCILNNHNTPIMHQGTLVQQIIQFRVRNHHVWRGDRDVVKWAPSKRGNLQAAP